MAPTPPTATPTPVSTQQGKNKDKAQAKYVCRATQTFPLFDRLLPNEPCFLDIEFQKYKVLGEDKERHRIGRIAILNGVGKVVLDVYAVYPNEEGVEKRWQPARFGVIGKDLMFANGAQAVDKVERWVAEIVKGRTVVMHGGQHDLAAFYYENDIWATSTIVDTQDLYGQLALSTLASRYLNMGIQQGRHSPIEDTDAMRELYLRLHPYDRAPELARIQAERAEVLPAPPRFPVATMGDRQARNSSAQNKTHTNLSGSAKRRNRNRNKAAAETTVAQSAADKQKADTKISQMKNWS